jgi:Rrf2 family protein
MKISSKTDYALRTVIDLALHRTEGVTQAGIIAKRQNISRDYLGQTLMTLKTAGIVDSKRGLEGGYILGKDPSEITVISIVELTESSLLNPLSLTDTENLEKNIIEGIWNDMTEVIARKLESMTIQDICDIITSQKNRKTIDYAI